MKIAIAGTRGIPASYGGFETFAEEIAVRLHHKGVDVTVICQENEEHPAVWNNVKLLYSFYSKADRPLRFYRDALGRVPKDIDILLVCGVGGAVFYPFMKRRRFKLITHVDGREELRTKYSRMKQWYVRFAQLFSARFSDHIITDSFAIRRHWIKQFRLLPGKVSTIEFGANISKQTLEPLLPDLDLKKNEYFLVVCRMVPENNLEMILNGYLLSGSSRKLVLVGDTPDNYGRMLIKYASAKIIFTGSVYEKLILDALRRNCFCYIHGHSVGGTNPSLLEAMAAGNICICHDNEFNRETTEGKALYFADEKSLAAQLSIVANLTDQERKVFAENAKSRISNYYNWERITEEYLKLFRGL